MAPAPFLLLLTRVVLAQTGTCDVSPGDNGASEQACVAAIRALGTGTVVADVFHDSNGLTADRLPLFGTLVDPLGGCAQANTICNGDVTAFQDQPKVNCLNASHDFATIASYVNALDWRYANPVRLHDTHGQQAAPNQACPDWGAAVVDGNKDGYRPWEGLVFDLGGPSNRVALFNVNDHGPQPCESVEYTVYLTDNPASRELIDNPSTTGADPSKWNRARLSRIFLEGWKKVRAGVDPGLTYTIEADSFTTVWSLPCGITFRYVGIIAGNDGKDLPSCNFDSFDAELDAVAGLTEGGAGVCPDKDRDGYVACGCPGAPAVCDCDDTNRTVHPGATEACDDADLNCDGKPSPCGAGLTCHLKQCLPGCVGELAQCPPGATCQSAAGTSLCIPADCNLAGCPAGSACDASGHRCVPSCTGVTCSPGQQCRDGQCLEPCLGVVCPAPLVCNSGRCEPSCSCFAADLGCSAGQCNRSAGTCASPGCANVTCAAGQACLAGACVGVCDGVTCPASQVCKADQGGCVGRCVGVTCAAGLVCAPNSGACVTADCVSVACGAGQTCSAGSCVAAPADAGSSLGDGGAGGLDGGSGSGSGHGDGNVTTRASGCGCTAVDPLPVLFAVFAALSLARGRRRS